LPRGRQLVTLKDAGNYIVKLPKAEYAAPEWQAAMECLILVAEKNGPTMMARTGQRVFSNVFQKIDIKLKSKAGVAAIGQH
jgi:hypothetical protein